MNPKDSSYLLRDDFYKHVQRDWPGYSEEERQLIGRLLARWVRGTNCTRRICHLRCYNKIKKLNLNICLYGLFVCDIGCSNTHRLAFPLRVLIVVHKVKLSVLPDGLFSHGSVQASFVVFPLSSTSSSLSPTHLCAGANQHSRLYPRH